MRMIVKTVLVVILLILVGIGIYTLIPHLKPNNTAFAPQTPSQTVSPRLKGIFKGMGEGFSK